MELPLGGSALAEGRSIATMRGGLGRLANAALARLGLAVVRRSRLERASHAGLLGHLKAMGVQPATIFDVGAARGTWSREASRQFPNAQFILVEPLAEFEAALGEVTSSIANATVVRAVAAREPGAGSINVHRDLVGSSLLRESEGLGIDGVSRSVPAVTIDDLSRKHSAVPPVLMKVDVQGGELEVLKGASRVLQQTQVVILEVSLMSFFTGGPLLSDVVGSMAARGFVVYDIIGLMYRPLDDGLGQVDLALVPEDSPLRRDSRFGTERQRRAQDAEILAELGRARE